MARRRRRRRRHCNQGRARMDAVAVTTTAAMAARPLPPSLLPRPSLSGPFLLPVFRARASARPRLSAALPWLFLVSCPPCVRSPSSSPPSPTFRNLGLVGLPVFSAKVSAHILKSNFAFFQFSTSNQEKLIMIWHVSQLIRDASASLNYGKHLLLVCS